MIELYHYGHAVQFTTVLDLIERFYIYIIPYAGSPIRIISISRRKEETNTNKPIAIHRR